MERRGKVDEVLMEDGSYRYNVVVQDEGRPPFVRQWFNDETPAQKFLEKILGQPLQTMDKRVQEGV